MSHFLHLKKHFSLFFGKNCSHNIAKCANSDTYRPEWTDMQSGACTHTHTHTHTHAHTLSLKHIHSLEHTYIVPPPWLKKPWLIWVLLGVLIYTSLCPGAGQSQWQSVQSWTFRVPRHSLDIGQNLYLSNRAEFEPPSESTMLMWCGENWSRSELMWREKYRWSYEKKKTKRGGKKVIGMSPEKDERKDGGTEWGRKGAGDFSTFRERWFSSFTK